MDFDMLRDDGNNLSCAEHLMMADLDRISKFVSFDIMLSPYVWQYLRGPERLDYDKYRALVIHKILNATTGVLIGNALDKLKLHFGHVFEQTIATPEQMQNIREDFEVETPSDNVQELTENEKLIMVDMVKMQSVLSGDDTISIRDELFEYLKSAERGIDYERFCDLLKITIRSIPDDPTSSKIMGMDLIKATFGDKYSPSLTLPNLTYVDLVVVENPNQHLVCKNGLEVDWLGEMRRHRVAKLTPEQIRVLVAVVNATRWEPSDYINWPNVAEKTGFENRGVATKQLLDKYIHLTRMCDVHTVEQYEEYHAREEPGGDTWRSKQLDTITFPPRRQPERETTNEDSGTMDNAPVPRIYLRIRRVNVQHFHDDIWQRVLATDGLFKPLVTLFEEHWEALFKVLNVTTQRTGRQIMDEFYGFVIPKIALTRYGAEGDQVKLLLRENDDCTMSAVVGAIQQPYDENAIHRGIHLLHRQQVISYAKRWPVSYWGNSLFDFLRRVPIEDFVGNVDSYEGLKLYWGLD